MIRSDGLVRTWVIGPLSRSLSLTLLSVAAVCAFAGCGGSSSTPTVGQKSVTSTGSTTATSPATGGGGGGRASVTIKGFAYHPARLIVAVGTTVRFTNLDSANHTVTSNAHAFDLGNLNQGQSRSFRFTKAGIYAYHCNYHPFMHGTVVVK